MLWRIFVGTLIGGLVAVLARSLITREGAPTGEPFERWDEETEPVLGFDGMERDNVIDWLDRARPDSDTLQRIASYERQHRNRLAVLEKVNDMLNGSGSPPSDRIEEGEESRPEGEV